MRDEAVADPVGKATEEFDSLQIGGITFRDHVNRMA
jgi:hypothetical protein